jgi:threonyl-tRNA synthetase
MVVVGEKDQAAGTVALRDRADGKETRDLKLEAVVDQLAAEVRAKTVRGA